MSADWTEMRTLEGQNFLADTTEPSKEWLTKYIPDEDKKIVIRTIKKAIETKGIFELEHRVILVDGSVGWTYSRAIPLFDINGELVEWLGVAANITIRKNAEEQLLEAKRQLEQDRSNLYTIFESLPYAVGMVEKFNKVFIYANQRAAELFGFDMGKMSLPQFQAEVKLKDSDGSIYQVNKLPISLAMDGQRVLDKEMVLEGLNGKLRFFSASAVPIVNTRGLIFAAVGAFVDITELKKGNSSKKTQVKSRVRQ